MLIRDALATDAAVIAAIHNRAVDETTAIWSETTVTESNRRDWIATRQAQGHVVLVAVEDGTVLAHASFGPFRPQDGYRATVEDSLYVLPEAQGRGIGRALLARLIDRARDQRRHAMIAAIAGGNTPSIALHQALGFRHVGLLPGVGQKFGRRLDLVLMQLDL